jgi:uncharacterized membrane protein YidH (DUF202 family)
MKINAVVGVLLIVLGVFALAYGGFTYTKKENVINLGPIQATADTQKTVPLPPILGGAALVAGVVLLVLSSKKGA